MAKPASTPQQSHTADPPPWHSLPADTVLLQQQAQPGGLSENAAQERRNVYGRNTLPQARQASVLTRFMRQFHNILIYVLLACVVVTSLLGHVTDALVILGVVLVNAVIGFVQEGKAEAAIDAIRKMLAPTAYVRRDGLRHSIAADLLVPGDIVLLEAGDRVPADLRVIECAGLQIQEAILTGESLAVEKQIAPVAASAAIGDRSSLAFSGTLVTSGQGAGVVVATGAHTEIGRISGMLADIETLQTPLILKMAHFARWLTGVILGVSGLLLLFGYYVQGHAFVELFMAVVGLAVAAIPEGLPAVLTITLAVGVQAMAKRHAIVRRLPKIETIGAVSVICTDKTGTLTRNEMQVTAVALAGQTLAVAGEGYAPHGTIHADAGLSRPSPHAALARMALAAGQCNDARLHEAEDDWRVAGDPMEGALLAFAAKAAHSTGLKLEGWTRLATIPFDARQRYMATLSRDAASGETWIFVKGAPETLLNLCAEQQGAQTVEPCSHAQWHALTEQFADAGQRVLALACKPVAANSTTLDTADLAHGLMLLGLTGLADPPRPEAIAAIAECRSAGIRVKMITGDHARTAAAIGRLVGLQNPDSVLTGEDIDELDAESLAAILPDTDIFARTSPEHKLRLVMALQAEGLSVAMTGDGVNDAPALKRADIGIAMGKKGSDAAKQAADLVLVDDNFASIVAAIREGRTVHDNVQKVIGQVIPTSIGEALTIVIAILFGLTQPITAVQILWVNLITETTLCFALAFDPTEPGTMRRPPRRRDAAIVDGAMVWYIVLVSALFMAATFGLYYWSLAHGNSIEHARSMVVNAFVVLEIFQLFFIRNLYGPALSLRLFLATPVLWLMVGIVVAAQALINYSPPLQTLFGMVALDGGDFGLIFLTGLATFLLATLNKWLRGRWT